MRRGWWLVVALLASTSPTFACTGESVHLEGDFETGDLAWGEEDQQFRIMGSEAVISPRPGTQSARWNAGANLTDLDACVTLVMPEATADRSRDYAGIVFWLDDKDNFYEAVIAPNGLFTVARKINGKMVPVSPVPWTKVKGLKLEPGDKNTMRVTLEGQTATITINDEVAARFRGQPPSATSHIGLVAASGPDGVQSWRMSDFKVTNVSPAPRVIEASADSHLPTKKKEKLSTGTLPSDSQCSDGKVLFADDFSRHDPTWGKKDSRFKIGAGEAVFTPVPGTRTFRLNRVFLFDDIVACATVRLNKNTTDPTLSYAGLVFWVKDNENYYQAVVAPSGYFTVARVVDGQVQSSRPIEWTKVDVIKTGSKQDNTLRVGLNGDNAEIMINGKKVGSFKGESPGGPSYVGLLASSASGKRGDTWTITDFAVAEPN